MKVEVVWLPPSDIYPREFHNGSFENSEDSLDYLAGRLMAGKKLEAIIVYPRAMLLKRRRSKRVDGLDVSDAKRSKKPFVLANGHHRFKIAKLLGLSLVPCVISRYVHLKRVEKVVWF